jgi:3-methyladenine DNA glycosylase AlkD
MNDVATTHKHIWQLIADAADANKAAWWNNYLREAITFIGVGIPAIRSIVQANLAAFSRKNEDDYFALADRFMAEPVAESKLTAILIQQLFLLTNTDNSRLIDQVKEWFANGYIFDWNTCDWLCVRVFQPMVDAANASAIAVFLSWHSADNFWQARCSLVPFAQSKRLPEHRDQLQLPMQTLIRRTERFAKTGVGWVLREMSRFDPLAVEKFLLAEKQYLTMEVINNALKYKDAADKKSFKQVLRNQVT